jgi:hypothetical protein
MSWNCTECENPEHACECENGPVEPNWVIGSYVKGNICTVYYTDQEQRFEFQDSHGAEAFENVMHQYALEMGENAAYQRATEFAAVNRGWLMEAVTV